ncbi:MAG: hypothetical protein JWN72_1555 [Thermoleophilia bacterium]|nr:hypothetical protein [Thermoleophilia bacterium]
MSSFRGLVGGVLGAAAAAVGLRVHAIARARNRSIGSVVLDLPTILTDDAARIADAARHAVDDGRVAAHRAGIEFDEQVAAHARRTKGNDV